MRFLKLVLCILLLSFSFFGYGQIKEPVKWNLCTKNLGNNEYELVFKASIESDWHLYSQFISMDGPLPTHFNFTENSNVSYVGKVEEISKVIVAPDTYFGVIVKYFKNEAFFIQKVKVIAKTKIEGYLVFMCCDGYKCIPHTEIDFEFEVGKDLSIIEEDRNTQNN